VLPFYTYNDDGTNRRENMTDWTLDKFRKQYKNPKLTKWDIFYYVYGILLIQDIEKNSQII